MRLFGKKIIPGVKIEVDTDNTDDATNNKNGIAQCLGLKSFGCKEKKHICKTCKREWGTCPICKKSHLIK